MLRDFIASPKCWLLVVLLGALGGFWGGGGAEWLSLEALKASQTRFQESYQARPWLIFALYFGGYLLAVMLPLPGAVPLKIVAGALFGVKMGIVLVSFASSLGATFAMLGARWLMREAVQTRFAKRLQPLNAGVERNGVFYLLTLRLTPVVPFFLINWGMGLTPIQPWTFYWVSLLGMLPANVIYVNAGSQLAEIKTLQDVISPRLWLSFVLLGLLPWGLKYLLEQVTHWRGQGRD